MIHWVGTWEHEGDSSAGVGRGHGGAVHQLRAAERPVGHGGDGSAGSADADAQSSVRAGPAGRPRVLVRRKLLSQRVFGHHHVRGDVSAHTCTSGSTGQRVFWLDDHIIDYCRSVPITLLVVPPGQPTVDRHGPLFPALDTNNTLYFCTASVMTSQILLRDRVTLTASCFWTQDGVLRLETKTSVWFWCPIRSSPWVGPVCRLPVTVVHQITLIVHHFNHLQENKNFVSVCLNQMLFGSVL